MKYTINRHIILWILSIFAGLGASAQNVSISPLSVIPAFSTHEDSVWVVIETYTSTTSTVISSTLNITQPVGQIPGSIDVAICYQAFAGSSTTYYSDTILLVKPTVGDYTIRINTYASFWPICSPIFDSAELVDTFAILPVINVFTSVLPANPAKGDDIRLAVHTTTRSKANKLHVTASPVQKANMVNPGKIDLDICFGRVNNDGITYHHYDTFNLGHLPLGKYYVNHTARLGFDPNTCTNIYDSTSRTDSFMVQPAIQVSVSTLPDTPTIYDDIKLLVATTTAGPAIRLNATANTSIPGYIDLSICYGRNSDDRTQHTYMDTLAVGKLNKGKYLLRATGVIGNSLSSCTNLVDTAIIYDTMQVIEPESIELKTVKDVIIHPNPAKEMLYIQTADGVEVKQVQLQNVQGTILRRWSQPGKSISLSGLPVGYYLLRIETDRGLTYKPVIKQ